MEKTPNKTGRYDDVCEVVLTELEASGVLLIVVNGIKGNGFSFCCTNPEMAKGIPKLLRDMADAIESDEGAEMRPR